MPETRKYTKPMLVFTEDGNYQIGVCAYDERNRDIGGDDLSHIQ